MKNRVAIWASAGFLIAAGWAIYALVATPPALTSADPMLLLVRLTCPIAFLSSYPIRVHWALLANAATYALIGWFAHIIWRRLSPRLRASSQPQ